MEEQLTSDQQSCDVCGTVVTDGEGYLHLETDDQEFGHVCSWLCAAQLTRAKRADQKNKECPQQCMRHGFAGCFCGLLSPRKNLGYPFVGIGLGLTRDQPHSPYGHSPQA